MNVQEFVSKWKDIELKEITTAQSHFIDVCSLVGHLPPLDADHKGEFFTFEIVADKTTGGSGRADAWYKGKFIWEYKRPGTNLGKAYDQLLLYRESLGNPPLLITSDTHDIFIHTNFTNTIKKIFKIDFESLISGDGLKLLKNAFYNQDFFKPAETQEHVTQATAETFVEVASTIQQWARVEGRSTNTERLAHFITRLLFILFSEDMGLLPENLVTHMVDYYKQGTTAQLAEFIISLRQLFATMRVGGIFGYQKIPYFNGGLFDDDFVPDLPTDIIYKLREACTQDWSNIDPSIFGTLFERVIDESKRAQLGAHYTGKEEIALVVEPVLMQPLRNKWQIVKQQVRDLIKYGKNEESHNILLSFAKDIADVRILDPACGSGNFLYVSLQRLLELQKEIITFAGQNNLPNIELTVNPSQLYGIEINPYAHELAQITVWIGYLQWRFYNGFSTIEEPILHHLKNIEKKDAILTSVDNNFLEPEWPPVDVIIGNPPFLGGGLLRSRLGGEYVNALFKLYGTRLPNFSDLCCYWFEKARSMISSGQAKRVGLLATQGIRGGANRTVIERIKESGNIFLAYSDRPWILDGANVHISIIGFDNGTETSRKLDGYAVSEINSNLTSGLNLTKAKRLAENKDTAFIGPSPKVPFDIDRSVALPMLESPPNDKGKSNSDVVRPVISSIDIGQRPRNKWTIDFGLMSEEEANSYELPFKYVKEYILPIRKKRRDDYRGQWWQYARPRPEMRKSLKYKSRYLATPRVSKHRIFIWLDPNILANDGTVVIAVDDDYTFGILQSSIHEYWARRLGTQLREAESGFRYTPTTTFETFPFPWPLKTEPKESKDVKNISDMAQKLNRFRIDWLNPKDVGISFSDSVAKRRTLTNLYNALDFYNSEIKQSGQREITKWNKEVRNIISLDEIEELDYINNQLDRAVYKAYGWQYPLSEEQILEKLLILNQERIEAQEVEFVDETTEETDED